jgi:xanthine dehydrogenase FAD-binding subunit
LYDIEALFEAESVEHALGLLREHPEAKIIAGGSDVLIQIREGRLAGCTLVSIAKLGELRGVSLDGDGTLRIGALTSFSHITRDVLIQRLVPVLGEAVDMVGGPQVRNIGTIGGNVCNGVTSADSASTLMAYDAVMEYAGSGGTRLVPIQEHYVSAGKTALAHDELLRAILIRPQSYTACYGHYIKYAMRNAMDIATLGCSVNVNLSEDKKTIARCRIGFGVAGPVPLRASGAEAEAAGKPVSAATVAGVAKAALNGVNPRSSWRAARDFRLHLVEELSKRALTRAINLAGGAV